MSAYLVLRCDDNDCTTLYPDVATQTWVARIHATEDGWTVDEHGDFCPEHEPDEVPLWA